MRKIKPVAFLSIILAALLIISATASSKVKDEDLYTIISGDASNLNSMNMISSKIFTGYQVMEDASKKEIEETRNKLKKRLEKQDCFAILRDGEWVPMTGSIDKEGYYLAVDKNAKYRLKESNDFGLRGDEFIKITPSLNKTNELEIILSCFKTYFGTDDLSNMSYSKERVSAKNDFSVNEFTLKGSKELNEAIRKELKFDKVDHENEVNVKINDPKIDRVDFIAKNEDIASEINYKKIGDIIIATTSKKSYVLKRNLEKKEYNVITSFEGIPEDSQKIFFEKDNKLFLLSYDKDGNLINDTFDTNGKNHKRFVKKDEVAKNFVKNLKQFDIDMVCAERYLKDGNINFMYITNKENNIFKCSKYTVTKEGEVKLLKEDREKFMERAFVEGTKIEKNGFINEYSISKQNDNKIFISVHQSLLINSSTWDCNRDLDFLYDLEKEEITFIGIKRSDVNQFIGKLDYIGIKQ